jgi:succinoglycan biosynthesis protein ExoM
MQPKPALSVCIITYRRPAPLGRLLASLANQTGMLPAFEVLIVDNDVEESALPVCKKFELLLPLRYVVEPMPGIAPARNRSVEASRAPYIAYLDDDQVVGPEWLTMLFNAAVGSGADGVFAPVVGKVEGELPEWLREVGFFDYAPIPSGSPIPRSRTRTGNCCLRRSALPSRAPFDVGLALVGGEDVELFGRMIRQGARLIAISEPVIHEIHPAARANAVWLIRRSFRNGGTFANCEWGGLGRLSQWRRAVRALFQSAMYSLYALRQLRRSRGAAFALFLRSCSALGRAAWVVGIVYAEYRRNR